MGLDQYLHARKYVSAVDYKKVGDELVRVEQPQFKEIIAPLGLTLDDCSEDYPSVVVELKVGYWRKANQIHKWFVDNVQDGEDDCGNYDVSADSLTELHNLCKQVLDDHDKAETLLPVSEGFFFGSNAYDEWYFEQLENTTKILERLLDNPKFSGYYFVYSSSW